MSPSDLGQSVKNSFSGAINSAGVTLQGNNIGTYNHGGSAPSSEVVDQYIRALGQTDPRDLREHLRKQHTIAEGSCEWILEHNVFKDWKSADVVENPLIWICDEQGTGKTVLAIYVSQHLEEFFSSTETSLVLYHFCNGQHPSRNTAASILKGFVHQLCIKYPALSTMVWNQYRFQSNPLMEEHSIESLWVTFKDLVNACPAQRIFCMADGIDECKDSSLDGFLKTLADVFTCRNQRSAQERAVANVTSTESSPQSHARRSFRPDVRMMLLSCEKPSLKELDPFPRIKMKSRDRGARVVEAKVDQIRKKWSGHKQMDKEASESVTNALNEGDDRNVLWIYLVAERLMGMTPSQAKEYVKHVPDTVEGMYLQTLFEVPLRQRKHVCAILKWVALAMRPLSILELTKAIKYSLGAQFTKSTLRKALTHCHGLVRQEDKEIVLAHQSVNSLLFGEESPLRQNEELGMFVFDEKKTHAELASSCIAYLQTSANLTDSRRVRLRPEDKLTSADAAFLRKHPFLEYATGHWTSHAKKANIDGIDYTASFFQSNSARRKLWWQSYWISLRQTFAWKWTTPGNFSLLHLAAFFGIVPLAVYLEQQGQLRQLLSSEDHQGMKPIGWATERSQAGMVKFLLERGEYDHKVLLQAAQTGDASIVQMVLENRDKMLHRTSSASPRPSISTSPLQSFRKATLSSVSSWSKKFEQKSETDPSVTSPELKSYGKVTSETPLHIAARYGHDAVIKVLLEAGEDFHMATEGGWSALHNAAWYGKASIVDRLIAAGVNVNVRTKEDLTPLHCAVKNSQRAIVEDLLCRWKADNDAEDHFGLNPFHMACKSNNIPMMEVLLDNGASVDKRMKVGYTPLHWACIRGRFAVAKVLLRRGADVNARWLQAFPEAEKTIEYGPARLARLYGHEGIARLVESFGAVDKIDLADADAKMFPPADVVEEDYNFPELQEAVTCESVSTEAEGSRNNEASGSAAMSEDENGSAEDSELSESGLPSRKESNGDGRRTSSARRQSSNRLHGLGIDQPLGERTDIDIVQVDSEQVEEHHHDEAGGISISPSREPEGLASQIELQDVSEQPNPSQGRDKIPLTDATEGEACGDNSTVRKAAKGRHTFKLDWPVTLGDRLHDLMLRRASSKDDTSDGVFLSPQSTDMVAQSPAEASNEDKPVAENAGNSRGGTTTSDVGILGRFGRRKSSKRDDQSGPQPEQSSAPNRL